MRITHLYELLTVSCARDGLVRFNSNMNKNKPCGLERLNSLEPRGSNRSWAVVKYCRSGLLMSGIISSFCALFFEFPTTPSPPVGGVLRSGYRSKAQTGYQPSH